MLDPEAIYTHANNEYMMVYDDTLCFTTTVHTVNCTAHTVDYICTYSGHRSELSSRLRSGTEHGTWNMLTVWAFIADPSRNRSAGMQG
jgi:hypothetical protein